MQLPEAVKNIIETLEHAGFEAYAVGGCVRDTLLHVTPNDWDITTSARPEEVKKLFRRTIDTGIAHGTVTVMDKSEGYEVTTFRIDGKYTDNRHPEKVEFTPSLSEDLRRRDFTVNAMAYSDKTGIVDLFGGEEDLKNGIIRAVGNPEERFTEDALRIMRCVRFAAKLSFRMDDETHKAAKKLAPNVASISVERIREELLKTIESKHPDYMDYLEDMGILATVLPSYKATAAVAKENLFKVPADRVLRISALLCKSGATVEESLKNTRDFMATLKFDNDTRDAVMHIIQFHTVPLKPEAKALRHFMNACGKESVERVLFFRECLGEDLTAVRREIEGIRNRNECTCLKELALTGRDLIAMGMKPGKEMGETLSALLLRVLDDPTLNTHENLHNLAKEFLVK